MKNNFKKFKNKISMRTSYWKTGKFYNLLSKNKYPKWKSLIRSPSKKQINSKYWQ